MRKIVAFLALTTTLLLPIGANMLSAQAGGSHTPHKAFVCKYVGKPGVDERLQTGQNPIDVDFHAINEDPVVVGSYFADAQGRSFVLAIDVGQDEPDVSNCPPGDTPPPVDVCPNIEGVQTTVPEGLIVDDDGNCVTPPTETPPPPVDVCPNLEGNQAEVPDGYVLNNDGQCVPIESPSPTPPPSPSCEENEDCPTSPPPTSPPPVPCEQTEAGCPTPPPTGQGAFVFTSCTDTFVRFAVKGNAWIAVDGVFSYYTITDVPTDIDLGQLPNGTVVYAGVNGSDPTTVTVDNDCPVVTPPPTEPPAPGPSNPPWHPTWHPSNAPGVGEAPGHDLAMTGFTAGQLVPWFLLLLLLGLGALGVSRFYPRKYRG